MYSMIIGKCARMYRCVVYVLYCMIISTHVHEFKMKYKMILNISSNNKDIIHYVIVLNEQNGYSANFVTHRKQFIALT